MLSLMTTRQLIEKDTRVTLLTELLSYINPIIKSLESKEWLLSAMHTGFVAYNRCLARSLDIWWFLEKPMRKEEKIEGGQQQSHGWRRCISTLGRHQLPSRFYLGVPVAVNSLF